MRLGYSEFIDKHRIKFLICLCIIVLVILFSPIIYDANRFDNPVTVMGCSIYHDSITPISLIVNIDKSYQSNKDVMNSLSYEEFIKHIFLPYYILHLFGSLIFWFTIISLIVVLVQHFKHKKLCKPLLYLPLAFYLIYVIPYVVSTKIPPFIGFYLAIIFEVLIILYCAGFQRLNLFPKRKTREPKPRRLTDKERIAELERQVAELQENKDLE